MAWQLQLQTGYKLHCRPGYQLQQILNQIAQLPRYVLSIAVWRARLLLGRATRYDVIVPQLWLLVKSSNISGKLEALAATRFMTDAQPVLNVLPV